MRKETTKIQKFDAPIDALISAFHSGLLKKLDKELFMHESYSNDHFELESYNTADTIPVATFLRNEQLPDEIIKKQYLYVCSFEWETTLGGREKFKEYFGNGMDILEALDKSSEGPKIIKTNHLLFEIRGDRWNNNDDINWVRLALYACEDASSHQEAAEWMMNELTTKGNEMYDADYFKKGTLEILI
ncbi:MAG: hypothetical protein JJ847_05660 [Prochlorococcus marinus CUG1438]|nr:hypothetical protein [Prochlorococcus marinus CUG1438]